MSLSWPCLQGICSLELEPQVLAGVLTPKHGQVEVLVTQRNGEKRP
jgi:hypothetical protein